MDSEIEELDRLADELRNPLLSEIRKLGIPDGKLYFLCVDEHTNQDYVDCSDFAFLEETVAGAVVVLDIAALNQYIINNSLTYRILTRRDVTGSYTLFATITVIKKRL